MLNEIFESRVAVQMSNSADRESRATVLIEIVVSRVAVQIEQQCRSRKQSDSADRDSQESSCNAD